MEVYSATASQATYDSSSSSISNDYDTWISLLTTQLENQDPTDPMDTNEMSSQLNEYAQLEQQVYTNEMLNTMIALTEELQNGTPTDYLGSQVGFSGGTASLADGSAAWTVNTPSDTDTATFTVTDADGNSVYETTLATAGSYDFTWDGLGNDGTQQEDGPYSLSVDYTTTDGTSKSLSADDIYATGTVTGVDWLDGEYLLDVDGQSVNSTDVFAIATDDNA